MNKLLIFTLFFKIKSMNQARSMDPWLQQRSVNQGMNQVNQGMDTQFQQRSVNQGANQGMDTQFQQRSVNQGMNQAITTELNNLRSFEEELRYFEENFKKMKDEASYEAAVASLHLVLSTVESHFQLTRIVMIIRPADVTHRALYEPIVAFKNATPARRKNALTNAQSVMLGLLRGTYNQR